MKRNSIFLLIFYCSLFLSSCDTASPEKYFDVAVLNSNRVAGFASNTISREMEAPSATMDAAGKTVSIKRITAIEDKIKFSEEMIERLNGFGQQEDPKDIVNSSLALYNYILPVYKNEYTQLAKLYDAAAPKEKIAALDEQIKEQYAPEFEVLYKDLIAKGKIYAAKHQIPVNWAE